MLGDFAGRAQEKVASRPGQRLLGGTRMKAFGRPGIAAKFMALMVLASVPMLMDCGAGGMPGVGKIHGAPAMPGSCHANIADASAIMSANFGLQGELEGKVKAALAAGADLQKIAADVEAEVTTACSNLAKDLGADDASLKPKADGPGKKAEAACGAAIKVLGEVKAKLGANAKVVLDIKPPKCEASMDASMDCAAKCDATFKPGSVEAKR